MQLKIVENSFITLFAGRPLPEEDLHEYRKKILFMLGPVVPACRFHLDKDLKEDLMDIFVALDYVHFPGNTSTISDVHKKIERSARKVPKVFSSLPVAKQLMQWAKGAISRQKNCGSCIERASALSNVVEDPQEMRLIDTAIALDLEIDELSQQSIESVTPPMIGALKSAVCRSLLNIVEMLVSVIDRIRGGDATVIFAGCKVEKAMDAEMKMVLRLQELHILSDHSMASQQEALGHLSQVFWILL